MLLKRNGLSYQDRYGVSHDVLFSCEIDGDRCGKMTIKGFTLPLCRKDPLAKLWAVNKCSRDIDITATFVYEEDKVKCDFILNAVMLEDKEEEYRDAIIDAFPYAFRIQVNEFVDIIMKFVLDKKYGYEMYLEGVKENESAGELNNRLNVFLDKNGIAH